MEIENGDQVNVETGRLLNLLERQEKSYMELLKLLQKQSQCLIKTNPTGVVELSEQSESLMSRIKATAKKADGIVIKIAVMLGMNAKSSYMEVIEKLSASGEKLKDKIRNITALISELAPANYKNALLIRQGLDIESFKMNAVKDRFSTENIYSHNGKLNKKDGFLLDKQV